ncbi:hypothetical protein SAMN04488000_12699 [Lentzea albida]|uniref:Helix-hairpin-helix motif-containing protein n=1 Tax=Lentzea albida TaxID=65499 RepID=A0A1H9X1J8_9PSEU|nr:hypothetical protein SAMN04488000_12699 [Lentzea albida]
MNRRRGSSPLLLRTFLAVVVVASSVVIPSAAQAEPSPQQPATSSIDLQNPQQGVADPVAAMRPLLRDCKVGQIDVNTAAPREIERALHLAEPAGAAVVSGRPWHRTVDLISVPGIGPSKETLLVERACATPTKLPPPTPLACVTGSDAVDLQSASLEQIASRTGLGRPAIERLIAARPLPQNLEQIVAPRVPGVSRPAVKRLVDDRAVCVTPAPFRFSGTSWRWASGRHGAVVSAEDPKYALFVPPGRVAGDTGAWATVKPLPGELGVLPSADFHIHGPWTPEVAVRVPAPPHSEGIDDVVVAHDRGDGDMSASFNQGTAESMTPEGRVVTAPASSLSTFTTYLPGSCGDPGRTGLFACSDSAARDTSDRALSVQWATAMARTLALAATNCDVRNVRARTAGFTTSGLDCVADMNGETGEWTFENKSSVLLSSGVVFPAVPKGGTFDRSAVRGDLGVLSNWLADSAIEQGFLPPNGKLTVRKAVGSGDTVLDAAAAIGWSSGWVSAQQVVSVVDEALDLLPLDDLDRARKLYVACSAELGLLAGADFAGALLECLSEPLVDLLERAAERYAGDDLRKSKLASAARLVARFLGKAFIAVDLALSAAGVWQSQGRTVQMRTLSPPPPPPAAGRFDGPSGDHTYIARISDGRTYLVETVNGGRPSRAIHIGTNGLFNCLAMSRYVVDDVQPSQEGDRFVLILPGGTTPVIDLELTCDPAGSAWSYTGVRHGGNVLDNVILKMPDWLGTGSWFIDGDGKISSIADGGTYLCLARAHPVIYNVPFDRISAWPDVADHPAACS